MIVRLRSKDGNFRFDLDPSSDVSILIDKILETALDADPLSICISNQPRGGETEIQSLTGRTLDGIGLHHGDLLFVSYNSKSSTDAHVASTVSQQIAGASETADDPVDIFWRQQDGKIQRSRDSRFCTHGPKAMCEYCSPLEPFDPSYHVNHAIKHLSFHSYLRKISPAPASGRSSNVPSLTPLSYRVKVPCPSGTHQSWPASICTACQPSAITLHSQPFRMVDHLEFASDSIIDRFLQAWRRTGTQRFGFLIGHYEPYLEVPMGIKAVVEAIHEPPQEGELDGLTLGLPWEDEARIRDMSSMASVPLTVVGQVFTDLTPDEDDRSKVVYKRHPQSFYMSSLEAIFAAAMQLKNAAATSASSTGQFSSRFVTAVLSGTSDGGIDIAAYQASEQACAMVDADMIEASVEAGIVRVKDEDRNVDAARYIPDVFFRYKNEYGRDVQKSAKPAFPVEYLLVNVTHGFPKVPDPMFKSTDFPVENRPGLENAEPAVLFDSLVKNHALDLQHTRYGVKSDDISKRDVFLRFLNDWHLVAFVGSVGLLSEGELKLLMRVATASQNNGPNLLDDLLDTSGWQNLIAIARESAAPPVPSTAPPAVGSAEMDGVIPSEMFDDVAAASAAGSGGIRICPHCTFENTHGGTDCDVCGLPLG